MFKAYSPVLFSFRIWGHEEMGGSLVAWGPGGREGERGGLGEDPGESLGNEVWVVL